MLYLDASSLLKLLLPEPESSSVQAAVASEETVILSALAELEAAGIMGYEVVTPN